MTMVVAVSTTSFDAQREETIADNLVSQLGILTPPTTQWQCDEGAQPTQGFELSCNGTISYVLFVASFKT
jgi:hypothetical protein